MTTTRLTAPERNPARTSSGSVAGGSVTASPPCVDQLAPQGLAEAGGRLGDLLEQEVGEVAPVDVAGGDLGGGDVVGGDRQGRPVVRQPLDALERAGPVAVEHHDQPALAVGLSALAGVSPSMRR